MQNIIGFLALFLVLEIANLTNKRIREQKSVYCIGMRAVLSFVTVFASLSTGKVTALHTSFPRCVIQHIPSTKHFKNDRSRKIKYANQNQFTTRRN